MEAMDRGRSLPCLLLALLSFASCQTHSAEAILPLPTDELKVLDQLRQRRADAAQTARAALERSTRLAQSLAAAEAGANGGRDKTRIRIAVESARRGIAELKQQLDDTH